MVELKMQLTWEVTTTTVWEAATTLGGALEGKDAMGTRGGRPSASGAHKCDTWGRRAR
jgi:hypothetical protein